MTQKLEFDCVDTGKWEAFSVCNDNGDSFKWRISICGDGSFSVYDSDKEISGDCKTFFSSFKMAEEWCQKAEDNIIRALCSTRPPTEFKLGEYQQAWHMASTACQALGLDYGNTSPLDIVDAIAALKKHNCPHCGDKCDLA